MNIAIFNFSPAISSSGRGLSSTQFIDHFTYYALSCFYFPLFVAEFTFTFTSSRSFSTHSRTAQESLAIRMIANGVLVTVGRCPRRRQHPRRPPGDPTAPLSNASDTPQITSSKPLHASNPPGGIALLEPWFMFSISPLLWFLSVSSPLSNFFWEDRTVFESSFTLVEKHFVCPARFKFLIL